MELFKNTNNHYRWKAGAYSFSLFIKDNNHINFAKFANENNSGTTNNQPNSNSKNYQSTKEKVTDKKGMSKFEISFWITIAILVFISFLFLLSAYLNTKEVAEVTNIHSKQRTVLDTYIDKYFPTDKLKENLVAQQSQIEENLKKELALLHSTIDREINNIFSLMEYRVDGYLDYHYSIAGEYSEIYAMANNKIDALVEEKLIGYDFSYKLQLASDTIHSQYEKRIEEHISLLNSLAFEGVNIDLAINQETINQLQGEIIKNQMLQEGKFSILIAGVMAKKISVTIATKIAAKASGKVAAKGAVKLGSKMAGAASAGALGLACGPGAVICGPVLAVGAWFATDAVIVTADEHLNRDKFKAEINSMINSQKHAIKRKLKTEYSKTFEAMSHSTQAKIAMTEIYEKRRVKVSSN